MPAAKRAKPEDYKWAIDLRLAVDPCPPGGRNAVFIPCIYHDDGDRANLAVYPDGVNCFACGRNVGPLKFIADMNGLNLANDRAKVQAIADEILQSGPVQAKQPKKVNAEDLAKTVRDWAYSLSMHESGKRLTYLLHRGIKAKAIADAKLGYTGRAYTIPLYDRAGALFSVKYRRDDAYPDNNGTPKYWNHPGTPNRLYYPPLFDWSRFDGKPVVLVEGEFDALALCQIEVPAVTCPTGVNGLAGVLPGLLQQHKSFVACLDQDEPGRAADERLRQQYGGIASSVAWLPEWGKDASEAISSGHGDALKASLRRAYAQALRGA